MVEADYLELLGRAKGGDITAFSELFERARTLLKWKLLKTVRNYHDVEDLIQETFLNGLESIATFRGESRLSNWLYRIAINLRYDCLRKEAKHPTENVGESFPEEKVRSPRQNPQGGRTKRGGEIELYSDVFAGENDEDPEEKQKECEEILRRAMSRLPADAQLVMKRVQYSRRRIPAKQLAAEGGFANRKKIFEIRRKFKEHCFRARNEIRRSKKNTPPVDRSP